MKFFICLSIVMYAWIFESRADVVKLDLKKTIQYAVAHSPSLEATRREMSISDMNRKNAYSVFLPQLDIGSTHGIRDRDPTLGVNRHVSELGLSLTETLYDNGISFLNYDSAKITKQIAELDYAKERDRLALDISAQFLQYSLVTRLLEVQKTQYDIINKQFNTISSQYKQGVKTRRDYLRFKSELRRSEIQLQNAQTRVMNTRADLIKLIASTEDVSTTDFQFEPEPVVVSSVKFVPKEKPAVENHWIFRVAKMRSEIFDNDISVARRSYYPNIFLTGGATYGSANYWKTGSDFKDNDFTSWNALLTVNFNLWDWGIRNRNISIAKDRKIQREKNIEADLNEFVAANEKLMANMSLSNSNFLIAQELLTIETDTYAFLESEYRNGRVSYLDLIIGLRDLLSAKNQMFNSFYDLKTQLLQYKYHQGKLYEEFQ
jgi:outer membrane protein